MCFLDQCYLFLQRKGSAIQRHGRLLVYYFLSRVTLEIKLRQPAGSELMKPFKIITNHKIKCSQLRLCGIFQYSPYLMQLNLGKHIVIQLFWTIFTASSQAHSVYKTKSKVMGYKPSENNRKQTDKKIKLIIHESFSTTNRFNN